MKFYFLQQRQSNDASPAKKTFVDSDIHNYSTRQNKAEQGRTVDQRFEKWIKGSSEKKFIRKRFMKRVLSEK